MQLGELELHTISGGRFRIDGGTMFGVVPRILWQRGCPPDELNRVPQATNSVLVRTPQHTLLIDTGYGSKLPPKQQRILGSQHGDPLLESLSEAGLSADDVDTVVLSHLHFDHAGGATRIDEEGVLRPTFPSARYVVQRLEWENAVSGVPELRGVYPLENLLPIQEAGLLHFIDGDGPIVPGVRALLSPGHTAGHMCVVLESGGETAVYLGDLCPTQHHLPILWCMAYDVDLLETRRKRAEILGWIADAGHWALFDHDPDLAAARLMRDDRRDFAIDDSLAAL